MTDLVKLVDGRYLWFRCPGCRPSLHVFDVGPGRWVWDGSLTAPTVSPSYLTWRDANPDATDEFAYYRTASRCHLFLRGGQLEFLSDCTHEFAGRTVPLAPWSDTSPHLFG